MSVRNAGKTICGEPDVKSGGVILCGFSPDHDGGHSWESTGLTPKPAPALSEGHRLAREQIAKHGKDRYPTLLAQLNKVIAEATELFDAIDGWDEPEMRKEYADAGLALYELGNKLGFDLITEMTALVDADERTF